MSLYDFIEQMMTLVASMREQEFVTTKIIYGHVMR